MKFFLVCLSLVFSILSYGQIITLEPTGAGANDEATLYFNAKVGAGQLVGEDKVYIHHGVVTSSPNGTDWQYVIGNWGNDDGIGEMEPVEGEEDVWKFTFSPDIRTHFGVPEGENIFRISCVFRSADGSKKGTFLPGNYGWGSVSPNLDFYVNLNTSNFISITSPLGSQDFYQTNTSIEISAVSSTEAEEFRLYLNGDLAETTNNTKEISLDYIVTESEDLAIRFEADIQGNTIFAEKDYRINIENDSENEPLPSGMKKGINYHDDSTKVTLVLEAPFKSFVHVVGDFTNWMVDDAYQMKKDGEVFWLTIDNLEPAKPYVFQYWIDGEIRIGDPYADQIADPWNDQWIEPEVYPNLPAYDKTEYGLASVLQTDQEAYEWSDEESTWVKPSIYDLVIYELHIRDFIGTHNYQDLIDTLSYIKRLGVDAIELMPINEFEGNDSWGYNPSYFFAPDKYYGTKDDLKEFIDVCHQNGLAVILDIVLNHAFGQNPMVRMYFEDGKPAWNNPWFNREYVGQYQWGYDFDHESSYTQEFVDSVNQYWLEEYHFDGYRFDFTKGFTNQAPGGSVDGYDASRIALLKRMADHIRTVDETAYIILEHWGPPNEEQDLADYGMVMWKNRSYDYVPATVGDPINGFGNMESPLFVSFFNSHDERRIAEHCLTEGRAAGSYNIKNPDVMYERVKMAAAFTYLYPGPKMIWQFDELGYDIDINFNGRTGRKPYPWGNEGLGYYEDEYRQYIYDTYEGILSLRKTMLTENEGSFTTDHKESGQARRLVYNTSNIDLVLIGNFGLNATTINPKFTETGYWYNYFSGDSILITNTEELIGLQAGEWQLFTNQRLRAGDPNVVAVFQNPVTISPYPFTLDDEISILFNPNKASTDGTDGLVDSEKIYMHAGLVTTDPDGEDWTYTVGNFMDDGVGALNPLFNDLWQIKLTPRTYFNIPEDETAFRLGMFFHDGENENRGKGFRNKDIYFDVRTNEPFITVSPYPFVADEEVTITFNAAQGNQELLQANKIYIHSGVGTTATGAPQSSAWNNVVGNWGADDGLGEMTPLGSNKWSITLIPADYYDLPEDAFPYWIAAVFRNESGSVKGTGTPGTYPFGLIAENFDFFLRNEKITSTGEVERSVLKYYPNPVKDVLHFESLKTPAQLEIFGSDGLLISSQTIQNPQVDLQFLNNGLYYFRIYTEGTYHVGKIIK